MDREEFVKGYMTRSGLLPYTLEGEVVTYVMDDGNEWIQHALECKCGEECCDGWAMIHHGGQNWHKFQNELTDMTYQQACDADRACRKLIP